MLVLDLSRIRTAQERVEQVYPPATFEQAHDDFRVVVPASLQFDIFKDKRQFRLVGRVQTVLELLCSRCLEPFELPVDAEFDLRYHPHTAAVAGEPEREVEEDDLTTSFYEHDEIDLRLLMQEQFYLTLPMKPLCEAGCQGLCPTCGTNLNRGTCECNTQWEDPRLAALRALKKES
jgi:uncharacterized protein